MPAGMIKGALSRLGFQAVVVPEITVLPQCKPILLPLEIMSHLIAFNRHIPSEIA